MSALTIDVGSKRIGLFQINGGDFPWMRGVFQPAPAFASVLFAVRPYQGAATHLDLATLAASGVTYASVTVCEEGGDDPEYLHALVFHADGTAGLRAGTLPLEDDERPPHAAITTPRLVLSPLTRDDADVLFAYRADPAVKRFQTFDPRTRDDAMAFIDRCMSGTSSWQQLGIRWAETGQLVGDVGYHRLPDSPLVAELGITVAPAVQRQGVGLEALRGLLGYLFTTLTLHRVYASVDPRNEASMALFAKLGMREEARHRASCCWKGEWADDVIFAMLRDEWV